MCQKIILCKPGKSPTMKRFFSILLILSLFVLRAQTVKSYSNEFLNIGVRCTCLGIGEFCIASSRDVTAGYWILRLRIFNQAHWRLDAMACLIFGPILGPIIEFSSAFISQRPLGLKLYTGKFPDTRGDTRVLGWEHNL